MLKLSDINEVFKQEELLNSRELDRQVLFSFLASVLCVQNTKDALGDVSVSSIVIVVVKDICKKSLGLHIVEFSTFINVVLIKYDFDVLDSVIFALLPTLLQSNHVLVEDVGGE